MKVAIIGGGLAGLSCAIELERWGVSPVIYERTDYIGEQYSHVGALINILTRPVNNSLKRVEKELGFKVETVAPLRKIIHYAENTKAIVTGNLGYILERSRSNRDFKRQIFSHLKNTRIIYNIYGDYEKLSKEYDAVVVASGNYAIAHELGLWREWFQGFIRGAVVLGEFEVDTLIAWINRHYCKSGYAYLVPFNKCRAFIGLIVPNVNEKKIEEYWRIFKDYENIKYESIEEYRFEHRAGMVHPIQYRNMYFVGNAGGSIEPFLGFGQYQSIIMGIMAGRAIMTGQDYEKMIKDILKVDLDMYYLRKWFDKLGNNGQSAFIKLLGLPIIKHIIYNSNFDIVTNLSNLIRMLDKEFNFRKESG